jgi:hypothetical protein
MLERYILNEYINLIEVVNGEFSIQINVGVLRRSEAINNGIYEASSSII